MIYKESLAVSKDFKTVSYDGVTYSVNKIKRIRKDVDSVSHLCSDGFYLSLDLRWIIHIPRKGDYKVAFCNKCKTLIVKKIK